MKRTRYLSIFLFFLIILFGEFPFLFAQQKPPFHQLKSYMYTYQVLISELEMMRRDKPTNWQVVDQKVSELENNLIEMKKFQGGRYQYSLDSLTASMDKLLYLEKKQDRKFFDQIKKIKQNCFQCHETHQVLGIRGMYE